MPVLTLNVKEIHDDGHRWRSAVIQCTDDGFERCSLDRPESAQQSVLAG